MGGCKLNINNTRSAATSKGSKGLCGVSHPAFCLLGQSTFWLFDLQSGDDIQLHTTVSAPKEAQESARRPMRYLEQSSYRLCTKLGVRRLAHSVYTVEKDQGLFKFKSNHTLCA